MYLPENKAGIKLFCIQWLLAVSAGAHIQYISRYMRYNGLHEIKLAADFAIS
jgi:hypothetical protein